MKTQLLLLVYLLSSLLLHASKGPKDFYHSSMWYNGCYPEAEVFLVQYKAKYPDAKGFVAVIELAPKTPMHAVAFCTYENKWWIRDNVMGFFDTGISAGVEITDHQKAATPVAEAFQNGKYRPRGVYVKPTDIFAENKMVVDVARSIPAAEVTSVVVKKRYVLGKSKVVRKVAVWRADGAVHVYHPEIGTVTGYQTGGAAVDGDSELIALKILQLSGWELVGVKR